jgi:hypothetical protein
MTFITGQRVADSPLPLSEAGIRARRNFDPLINAASECIPSNLPSLLMIPYIYEISRDGDTVNLTGPFSAKVVWHRLPHDSPIYEFDCDAEIALRSTQNAAVLKN